ncbi:MAG: ankyrin repeat domain-containing protein, partial [Methanosarcinaceae archaeon]|nr:ankyrin repeat domain-containing protein [Methanosarcinaceae archaeon]
MGIFDKFRKTKPEKREDKSEQREVKEDVSSLKEEVKIPLNEVEDIDAADGDSPALIKASDQGNIDTVKLLLDKGANIDYQFDNDGETALMKASARGHAEVVKLLLDRGAN